MKRLVRWLGLVGAALWFSSLGSVVVATAAQGGECAATFDDGNTVYASIQAAVDAAPVQSTVKIAGVCSDVFGRTVTIGGQSGTIEQAVYIDKSMTLEGGYAVNKWRDPPDSSANPTLVNAGGMGRVVVVYRPIGSPLPVVVINHLMLINGDTKGDSFLTGQASAASGGGILLVNSDLSLNDSLVGENSAEVGAGIANYGGTLTIHDSQITLNSTTAHGGGIYLSSGALQTSMSNSVIDRNTSGGDGGGIYNYASASSIGLTIHNSILNNNEADTFGGGLFSRSPLTIMLSRLADNTAGFAGGGLFANDGVVHIVDSTLAGNSADFHGGAIKNGHSTSLTAAYVIVTRSTLSNNMASGDGGGIHNEKGTLDLINSTLAHNTALDEGGGIFNTGIAGQPGLVTLHNSTLSSNTSTNSGGGVYNRLHGQLLMLNSIIANSAGGGDCVNETVSGASGLVEASHMLIQMSDNEACNVLKNVDGNLIGEDANLGNLANNGGTTQTYALPSNSPAVNAGSNAETDCPATDQRTLLRTDGMCDIGAYEVGAAPTAVQLNLQEVDTVTQPVWLLLIALVISRMSATVVWRRQ